jgi:hypothetical protein
MKKKSYKRKPGDFEIRILKNGKVVMMAPDEALMEIAQIIDLENCAISHKTEKTENVRNRPE